MPAILEGWYLGQEGGTAVADVLFGDVNPGRQAADHVPARTSASCPSYYDRKPTSFRVYLDLDARAAVRRSATASATRPSSSTNLKVAPATIGPDGQATVTVDVTNTGARAGDEVVQLYVRDVVSSVTRPVKELRGFERVTLRPGERKTRHLHARPGRALVHRSTDAARRRAGPFDVMVGTSSKTQLTATLDVVSR